MINKAIDPLTQGDHWATWEAFINTLETSQVSHELYYQILAALTVFQIFGLNRAE
jgi:hypothetical protein